MTVTSPDRGRVASLLRDAGLGAEGIAVRLLPGTGNRTFAATWEGGEAIVRLPGSDTGALVDRAVEHHNLAVASRLGVGPGLLHADARDGAVVMTRAPGSPLGRRAGGRGPGLGRLGATLARLHGGPPFRGLMDPWAKIALYLHEAGIAAPDHRQAFGPLWPRIVRLRDAASLDPRRLAPCHVDPVPENAIDDGARVVLVDWEYAAMSEPLWDLAYVCVEGGLDPDEEAALLDAYGMPRSARTRLGAWKTLSRAVSAAWCMARAAGSDAPSWRHEVAIRLAALEADLDHPAAPGGVPS